MRVLLLVVACIVACSGSSKQRQRGAGEPSAGQPSGASAGEGGMEPVAGTSSGGVSGTNTGGLAGDDGGAAGDEAGGGTSGTAGSGAGGAAASSGSGAIDPPGGAAGAAGSAGSAGAAGSAGVAGSAGAAGSGGSPSCTNGECWDGMRCETDLDALGCPTTYDVARDVPPPEHGADCSGATADGYIYIRQALDHSLLCAYGAFGPLVYAARRDAAPVHCNQQSRDIVAGQARNDLRIVHYQSYRGCAGVAENSRSELFNELFPEIPPEGSCTPAEDECRGRVSLLVCEDSRCNACTSDTQCAAEYPYLGDAVTCSGGLCRLGSLVGACSTDAPTTACNTTSEAYACVARRCVRCTTHEDCVNTTGNQQSTCSADGTCVAL